MTLADSTPLAQAFPQASDMLYLNHAAVAPWPRVARDAVIAFASENTLRGAADYPRWLQVEQSLRRNLAALINAPGPQDIALCKNTSEALSFVAMGIDWQAGDEVIITDQEFPSNRIVWEALADRGVVLRIAAITHHTGSPEAAIAEAFTPRTRLLAVSSVQYGTGLKLDIPHLGALCRKRRVLFCLDAIQSIGAEPLDVQACQVDFTMADGHKWMLGPEGLALFYVRPAIRDQLKLQEFGWHMVAARGDYDRKDWQPAADASRFECGSPNMLAAHALEASTGLLLATGLEQVREGIARRVDYLEAGLAELPGFQAITPKDPQRRLGIFTFTLDGHDSKALQRQLMQRGLICACRGGGIRFSPHYYTPFQVLDDAIALVRSMTG
ncbi:MAG: aminotransferase class V-fold PLP-dependent enzyme [Halomonadaceae bacterium]|nr:MAG: aminotransferase class V-fold PLP-dependent enzyme [Halomonadaceae bacterium]